MTTIVNVQILRAAAALAVLTVHALMLPFGSDTSFFPAHFDLLGAAGVDVFFVISGFIIARKAFLQGPVGAPRFFLRRLRRVAPLYFVLSSLVFALNGGAYEPLVLLATFTMLPIGGVLPILGVGWTLSLEMVFYTAIALVLALGRPWAGLVALGVYVLLFLVALGVDDPLLRMFGNAIYIEFLLGVAVAFIFERVPRFAGIWLVAIGVGWVIATGMTDLYGITNPIYMLEGRMALQRVMTWGVPAFLIVLGAAASPPWVEGRSRVGRVLLYLGAASYSIYLAHGLVLLQVSRLFDFLPVPILNLFGFGAGLAGSLVVFRYVELPLSRLRLPKRVSA
jgi:peptidoglycan/LPS O-acetylase OafA/YrhL